MNKSQFIELFMTALNTECEKRFPKAQAKVEIAQVKCKSLIDKTVKMLCKKHRVPNTAEISELRYGNHVRIALDEGVAMELYLDYYIKEEKRALNKEVERLKNLMRAVQPCTKVERIQNAKKWVSVLVSSVRDLTDKEAKAKAKAMAIEYLTPVEQCEV